MLILHISMSPPADRGCGGEKPCCNTANAVFLFCLAASNVHHPKFTKNIYAVSTPEDVVVAKVIAQVEAKDIDSSVITYDITAPQKAFSINKSCGDIVVFQKLDRETASVQHLCSSYG